MMPVTPLSLVNWREDRRRVTEVPAMLVFNIH